MTFTIHLIYQRTVNTTPLSTDFPDMSDVLFDIRYGLRQLRKHAGFTTVAVLALALGIGAASSVFVVGNSALLRPLPGVADPSRLVSFYRIQANDSFDNLSYPDYLDYRDRARTFSGIAAHCPAPMAFRHEMALRVIGDVVTGNYFEVLRVKPALGRLLSPADDHPAAAPVVVLSDSLWKRSFHADPQAVGTSITLNGHQFTIAGIAPEGFTGTVTGQPYDLWAPLSTVQQTIPRLSSSILASRNAGWLNFFGRLQPGATIQQAGAEIKTLAAQLATAYPLTNANRTVAVIPGVGLGPDDRAEVRRLVAVLAISVALLLLIACTNVAALFLVRSRQREREIALRQALGAGRARIVRQLLTEGMLIALIAGTLGVITSQWTAQWMAAIRPGSVLHRLNAKLDLRVALFALAVSIAAGVLFALTPALRSLPADLIATLKNGGRGATRRQSRLQWTLVILQVTLSFVLLTGAGVLTRNLYRVMTDNPGYETRSVAMSSLDLIIQGYSEQRGRAFYRELLNRLPQAALATSVPPEEWPGRVSIFYPGEEPPPEVLRGREMELGLRVDINTLSPGYFRTLGMALKSGRDFNPHDDEAAPRIAIVNDSLAKLLWPRENAIGKRISWPDPLESKQRLLEVVGVASDTKSRALTSAPVPMMYVPLLQNYNGRITLLVRNGTFAAMEQTLATIDKDLSLYNPQTMTQHVARSLWEQRMITGWVTGFSLLALALAAIGLYGLIAQSIAQRKQEIAIRIALGATPARIRNSVLREGMLIALAGLALGSPLTLQLTGSLRSVIPGVTADLGTMFLSAVVLSLITVAACAIATRHACNAAGR
ncbi:MAG TPA: ABC transporter permease [Bryobacteraceae bacterium]|nr:ABC transporter permease [Bryobacteraceae bacterium]